MCYANPLTHSLRNKLHQNNTFIQTTRIVQKLVTRKPLSKAEIKDLKNFAQKTAITLGLTALGIGAIALYKQCYSTLFITLPVHISRYNQYQHANAIHTIINDQETAGKLWSENKSLPELVSSVMNSVNTKETYIFTNDNNVTQGFITIKGNHIYLLAVNKECRGNGIGSKLLTFATNHLANNHKLITIDVEPKNNRAQKLYESHGFQFAAEPYAPGLLRGTKKVA
jgi:hypothetical protein